ncbi:unnamed protein product [Zymoseptoria tritici ST99CH_3D1]|nr:unnamed protein product [Zymoseptoria tritici ST99CH_3D1]
MDNLDEQIQKLVSPSQRFIKITIGEDTSHPIHIAQQVLEGLSPYFVAALKDDTFEEGVRGELSFPEDETDVWAILLHWIFYHEVPPLFLLATDIPDDPVKGLHLAVRCWTTGDKYRMAAFQDEVMLRILRRVDAMYSENEGLDIELVKVVCERTLYGSPLRELFVDWTVMVTYGIRHPKAECVAPKTMSQSYADEIRKNFEKLDGTGLLPEMLAKKALYDSRGRSTFTWRANMYNNDDPRWTKFFLNGHGKNGSPHHKSPSDAAATHRDLLRRNPVRPDPRPATDSRTPFTILRHGTQKRDFHRRQEWQAELSGGRKGGLGSDTALDLQTHFAGSTSRRRLGTRCPMLDRR